MKKRTITLRWPSGGVNKQLGYQSQPPYTTPSANNVRSEATLESRERGGQRPGLSKFFAGRVSLSTIRTVGSVLLSGVGTLRKIFDHFQGGLDDNWSAPTTFGSDIPQYLSPTFAEIRAYTTSPATFIDDASGGDFDSLTTGSWTRLSSTLFEDYLRYYQGHICTVETGTPEQYVLWPQLSIDISQEYTISVEVSHGPEGSYASSTETRFYTIILRMNPGDYWEDVKFPSPSDKPVQGEGVRVVFWFTPDGTAYEWKLVIEDYHLGVKTTRANTTGDFTSHGFQPAGTLQVVVNGDTITVKFEGETLWSAGTFASHTGTGIAFSMHNLEPTDIEYTPEEGEYVKNVWASSFSVSYEQIDDVINATHWTNIDGVFDFDEAYTLSLGITPTDSNYKGTYYLLARMSNDSPDITDEGVRGELVLNGDSYEAVIRSFLSGTETNWSDTGTVAAWSGGVLAGIFKMEVDGDQVTLYLDSTQLLQQTVNSHAGVRIGWGMSNITIGGSAVDSKTTADYFDGDFEPRDFGLREVLFVIAGGEFIGDAGFGVFFANYPALLDENEERLLYEDGWSIGLEMSDSPSLSSKHVAWAERAQKVFVADYGEKVYKTEASIASLDLTHPDITNWKDQDIDYQSDVVVVSNGRTGITDGVYTIADVRVDKLVLESSPGTGVCDIRVERGPKVYDPKANSYSIWTATAGDVPAGCPVIARFRDSIFLAGAETDPHLWYLSRLGDPFDWDYSSTDSDAAVAGNNSDAGVVGKRITAACPFGDEALLMAGTRELWVMLGDPRYNGRIYNLSRAVGIIDKRAWTNTPDGGIVFLAPQGLFYLANYQAQPQALSEHLPEELKDLNDDNTVAVHLTYDPDDDVVHIFVAEETAGAGNSQHWVMEMKTRAFWPVSFANTDHEPFDSYDYRPIGRPSYNALLLGCRDGYLRKIDSFAADDDGTEISSYVEIGPIHTGSGTQDGMVDTLDARLAQNSADVDWQVRVGDTAEDALDASASVTGTWSAGLSYREPVRTRGYAFFLRLKQATSGAGRWAMETVEATLSRIGRHRKL